VTAYFDSFNHISLPFPTAQLAMSASEQMTLATGRPSSDDRLLALATTLFASPVPAPAPQTPCEITLQRLGKYYRELSLIVWDQLKDPERQRLGEQVREELPVRTLERYEELFRRLARAVS
jgi:hypothetical protein